MLVTCPATIASITLAPLRPGVNSAMLSQKTCLDRSGVANVIHHFTLYPLFVS